MIRKTYPVLFLFILTAASALAQPYVKTSGLFVRDQNQGNAGKLELYQPVQLDTLISRHILANQNLYQINNHYGMEGFRLQIYASNNRNAREESNKARAQLISKFPDIVSYPLYAEPGYFKVRVGDFRTRSEAFKLYQAVSSESPGAYILPDVINFPDLKIK